jgi:hypothetical protein
MTVTLDWLGCATFRLQVDDTVIMLDAYFDRVPSAPDVGLTAADISRADAVLVGHSHFDHIAGAEVIAANTGAPVIGSNESARVLIEAGISEDQLLRSQGGERHRITKDITVEVFPSLHSCIWTTGSWDPGKVVLGQYGLTEEERWGNRQSIDIGGSLGERSQDLGAEAQTQMIDHVASCLGSNDTGGALAYLIDTPYGSIFYHDTSGCWTGVVQNMRPDVAIVAMAGRPNIDGEPIQGSLAQFVGRMSDMLRAPRIVLGHHDDWMPPMTHDMTGPDSLAPVKNEINHVAPRSELLDIPLGGRIGLY